MLIEKNKRKPVKKSTSNKKELRNRKLKNKTENKKRKKQIKPRKKVVFNQSQLFFFIFIVCAINITIGTLLFSDKIETRILDIRESSVYRYKPLLPKKIEKSNLKTLNFNSGVREIKEDTYEITKGKATFGFLEDTSPIGLTQRGDTRVNIPFGQVLEVYLEVKPMKDSVFIVDLTHQPSELEEEELPKVPYGDTDGNISNERKEILLEEGVWNKVSYFVVNNNKENKDKINILNETTFGMSKEYFETSKQYQVRNIRYALEKYK